VNVPQGHGQSRLRCLENNRASGSELSRAGPRSAYGCRADASDIGPRFLGRSDLLLLNTLSVVILLPIFGDPMALLDLAYSVRPKQLVWMLGSLPFAFLLCVGEGRWGGCWQTLCRLRVVRPDNNPPGFHRAVAGLALRRPADATLLDYLANPKAYAWARWRPNT
jgi:hypothetical protein